METVVDRPGLTWRLVGRWIFFLVDFPSRLLELDSLCFVDGVHETWSQSTLERTEEERQLLPKYSGVQEQWNATREPCVTQNSSTSEFKNHGTPLENRVDGTEL